MKFFAVESICFQILSSNLPVITAETFPIYICCQWIPIYCQDSGEMIPKIE